jgi:hypothetical protein
MREDGLYYLTDNVIRMKGPVDITTGAAITGATVTAEFFHDKKDMILTADAVLTDDVFFVNTIKSVRVGDPVYIETLDKAKTDIGNITVIDAEAKTIQTDTPLSGSKADLGARLVVPLQGTPMSLSTAYGTPVAGEYDWGYYGVLDWNVSWMTLGLPVRIERFLAEGGRVLNQVTRHVVTLQVSA